jgi:type I restriction enzyme R subunit
MRQAIIVYPGRQNGSELAFYDAPADNESAILKLGDEILKRIALELTEKLRNSTKVDWWKMILSLF